MSPQIERLKVPLTLTLARRPTHDARAGELPMLRDEQGRVRAIVEAWSPATAVN